MTKPVFKSKRLSGLASTIRKPKRKVTIEEMDEAIRKAIADRYVRAVGRKKR